MPPQHARGAACQPASRSPNTVAALPATQKSPAAAARFPAGQPAAAFRPPTPVPRRPSGSAGLGFIHARIERDQHRRIRRQGGRGAACAFRANHQRIDRYHRQPGAKARPWATPQAVRRPVKEPGPAPTRSRRNRPALCRPRPAIRPQRAERARTSARRYVHGETMTRPRHPPWHGPVRQNTTRWKFRQQESRTWRDCSRWRPKPNPSSVFDGRERRVGDYHRAILFPDA